MWSQVKQELAQSTARFLTRFIGLLPGIAALIVALLASILLAWILATIVRRLLTSMHFDQRLARWGFPSLAEWSPLQSPTLLVAQGIATLVVVAGILIGVAAVAPEWTSLLVQSVFAYVPNVVGAVLVLVFGSIVARFLSRSVLIGAVNLNLRYARLLSVGVRWLVVVLAVAMALEHLRIAPGIVDLAFGILFGGIVFAMALAVGLGSKDLVTKSLERDAQKASDEHVQEPFRHV
jgi:ABC-type multidrug transport system fused ATPase/permease subunit